MSALIRFLFRKMWNTRWLTLSTFAGLLVAVAFTASIPMYADGSLKRVVAQTLREHETGLPAGALLFRYQSTDGRTDPVAFSQADRFITEEVPERIGFPVTVEQRGLTLRSTEVSPEDPLKVDASRTRRMTITSLGGLEERVELAGGKWFAEEAGADGTLQAVMLEEALFRNDLHVGDVLLYPVYGGLNLTLRVEIVGSVRPLDMADPYWYQGLDSLMNALIISERVFLDDLVGKRGIPVQLASWYAVYDLSEITTSRLTPLSRVLNRVDIEANNILKGTRVEISFRDMLADFRRESVQLQTMLFTLAAPMIAMAFYFITMIARQSLENQRTDIAVLRSRGASRRQIMLIFLLEGALLGGAALLLGPAIGWFMAKSIGSANGFLEFVNRKSIPVGFSSDSALAALLSVLVAIGAAVIPALVYTRASIVDYRRMQARKERPPFWMRWYLDVVLLGVAAYGWYLFNERQMISFRTGLTTDQLNVQPFLFFVPAIFIFALGLLFLRLFPLMLRLISWLARRNMPIPLYLTVTQLSRSSKAYYPLMILLVLTLGLGVYNASAARTIHLNSEERILYKYGADVIVQTVWEAYQETSPSGGSQQPGGGGGTGGGGSGNPGGGGGGAPQVPMPSGTLVYNEPPFEVFRTLPGVRHAAKVVQTKASLSVSNRTVGQGMVVGIETVDFARVAWFRTDLYKNHPFRYLAAMGQVTEGAIISSNLAERYELKTGDLITAVIAGQPVEFVIIGIVPYWPAQYPDQLPFLVANLGYIYDQVPMIPYDVWLDMEPGADVLPIVPVLREHGIEIASIQDVENELIAQSRHPARGGVFGILSLGFLITVIVSLAGYIIFWFFNLSGRTVQMGVLRATGLFRRELTAMLLFEQVFTAGLSIAFGILTGKLASLLFLPFLQTTGNAANQVPPFRVVFEAVDDIRLYSVVAVMMGIGAALLVAHIRNLRVHQAVKMGEER
ncbi:MAG: ABC transporter permease [Paenibacillaceae bacterium ZCTH02-B3]|nr:MAG: ABC transporter permease [Paenibacillaceae bacterium ZCTH02-B3]